MKTTFLYCRTALAYAILSSAAMATVWPVNLPADTVPMQKITEEPLMLWYKRQARQWVEALAIGNGRLGAMVFGGVENERIQLNEDTLWGGGPYDPNNPQALAALPEARRLISEGKYREASGL